MLKKLRRDFGRFSDDARGSTGMVFGIAAVPLMVAVGAGFDIHRASTSQATLQQATDALAIAVAKEAAAGKSGDALLTYANSYLAAETQAQAATITGFPSVNATTGEVCVATSLDVATTMMRIANFNNITVRSDACAQVAAGSFEIALVLDTTGSMDNNDNSNQKKLLSMQNAAKSFINSMFDSPTLGPRTKMSVVPFAPSVNVGATYSNASWMDTAAQSSWHWKSPLFASNNSIAANRFGLYTLLAGKQSSWAWGGCVESLPYPLNVSDDAPAATNPDSYFVPMLAPDEPANVTHTETTCDSRGKNCKTKTITDATYPNSYIADKGSCSSAAPTGASVSDQTTAQSRLCKYKSATVENSSNGPNEHCLSKPLVRLQTSKTNLISTVNSLTATGSTNIHEGFMWGWRTISPNAPFADGVAYNTNTNTKVIVLMTDGENTWSSASNDLNGSHYSAYGYYNSANGRMPPTNQDIGNSTQARAAMDQLVREACSSARAKGVTIYTIAFSGKSDPIDDQGKQLLRDCAGDDSRYYAPNSQTSLSAAFTSIGSSIGKLRITR